MRRRHALSLVAVAPLFSGCSAVSSFGSGSSRSEGSVLAERRAPSREELPTRPRPPAEEPPGATGDTASPRAYPERPREYTEGSVSTFVQSYERAYRRNDVLADHGRDLEVQDSVFDWAVTLDATGTAGVGKCQYRSSYRAERTTPVYSDSPTTVATYYVDDATVVRASDTAADQLDRRDDLSPDPWESGVVLEPSE